ERHQLLNSAPPPARNSNRFSAGGLLSRSHRPRSTARAPKEILFASGRFRTSCYSLQHLMPFYNPSTRALDQDILTLRTAHTPWILHYLTNSQSSKTVCLSSVNRNLARVRCSVLIRTATPSTLHDLWRRTA